MKIYNFTFYMIANEKKLPILSKYYDKKRFELLSSIREITKNVTG